MSYKDAIKEEVKEWVTANIDRWKVDKPEWFQIELIPDDFLPQAVLEAEGGEGRIKATNSILSIISRNDSSLTIKKQQSTVHPQNEEAQTTTLNKKNE